MNKVILYAAILIGIFLVVVYYKGSQAVISTGGGALGNLVMFLQGRNKNGQITNYPS